MKLPPEASIREVGPRDGLQNEDPVSAEARVRLIDALSSTGLRRIEAVSFVNPKAVPSMAGAEDVWRQMRRAPGVTYSALVPNARGAERALECGAELIQVVVSASETHNLKNVGRPLGESLAGVAEIVERARAAGTAVHGTISTVWGCPYEGEISTDAVFAVAEAMLLAGVTGFSFGDTTGMATPARVVKTVGEFSRRIGSAATLNLHFHNTRGTGLANVLAALDAGCADFDASVGGLGGCPYAPGATGNISTEDLVYMLEDMGVSTGVDLAALIEVARLAEEIVGRQLPGQVMRAGPRTKTVAV